MAHNVSADDCEKVSHFLSDRLDQLDPIETELLPGGFVAGMDRPLLKDKDFIRYERSSARCSTLRGIDSKKKLTGKLIGRSDGYLHIEIKREKVLDLPREKVSENESPLVF